jgi:iron(III) transport system substrate-binding protein
MKMTSFAFPNLKLTRRCLAAAVFTAITASTSIGFAAEKINIYSHRQQVLIQPFLDAFTAKTGIETNVVYSSKGLAQRLKAEGPASPADVILTVDIARLSEYADLDLLAPVDSSILRANIPSRLRSKDNRWFGFSERASPKGLFLILKIWPNQNGRAVSAAVLAAMIIIALWWHQ